MPGRVAMVLAAAAAAWAFTAARMGGMDAGPGSDLGDLGWFTVSWLLMMAAMMLPAIAPVAVGYGRPARFAAGYLTTWVAAGLVAYAAVEGVRSLEPGFLVWDRAGRYVAAAVIVAAGVYQLTRPKRACLRQCRDRRAWLPQRGPGAVRQGARHGLVCVGCSWALMAALIALGAMNLTWMAVVAALIAAERLLPRSDGPRRAIAIVLLVLGAAVALSPGDVPGLIIPGPGMGMHMG